MSLPDATRSDRVYPLLQNLDLENLTFATLQGVGETLSIEEMSEDEMRRLVLINLCRLTCAGEWDGLLSAGGSTYSPILPMPLGVNQASGQSYALTFNSPFAIAKAVTSSQLYDTPRFFPWVAPVTGTIASFSVDISANAASTSWDFGVYSTNSLGAPGSLVGSCTIATDSSGLITQGSFTSSIATVQGTQYWIGWVKSSGTGSPQLWCANDSYAPLGIDLNNVNNGDNTLYYSAGTGSLPASPTASQLRSAARTYVPVIGIIWS